MADRVARAQTLSGMKPWCWALWLLPVAALIPLGLFLYSLVTADWSVYFGEVQLVGTIFLLGVPASIVLAASVVGAVFGWRRQPLVPLLTAAIVWASQLTLVPLSPDFYFPRDRVLSPLILPGIVAGVLALWGLLLLRHSNRGVVVIVIVLLLTPILSFAWSLARYSASADACPPGPAIDITFTGIENAHFTKSCGTAGRVSTQQGCSDFFVIIEMFDGDYWYLTFDRPGVSATSDQSPKSGPTLNVGSHTTYGGGLGWNGSYSFDAGNRCAGTIDADLSSAITGPRGTYVGPGKPVHVSGHFDAPIKRGI
jgi:hypothetical protein